MNNIPNSTKKAGRPRKFDMDEALNAAVEVFWRLGYDGASLDDLTKAMGMKRPSLYAAFGNKEALYLKALEHYGAGVGSLGMQAFLGEPIIAQAVAALLSASLDAQAREGELALGCLLGTCAPTAIEASPATRDFLQQVSEQSHAVVVERFEAERAKGTLAPDFPVGERAALLLDLVQAQAYRARLGEPKERLAAAIENKAAIVLRAND